MEEMISGLIEKTGISKEQAEKVVAYLKENASKVPGWLGSSEVGQSIKDKLPGGLGGML